MNERLLFVDDEANILSAYRRQFRGDYQVDTASSGADGLEAIANNEPYAVIVSDLRMPGIDGIEFLDRVRTVSPNSVRVMLTGHADVEATMAAVNQGNIFRFLTKPVEPAVLEQALDASLAQYRLITAERRFMEQALEALLAIFNEILSLACPDALARSRRVRKQVAHMAARLDLKRAWQFRLAAELSQVGCIPLPPRVREKVCSGQPLADDELILASRHPAIARSLVAHIPRLGEVAEMIARQQEPVAQDADNEDGGPSDRIALGGQLLRVSIDFDQDASLRNGRRDGPRR